MKPTYSARRVSETLVHVFKVDFTRAVHAHVIKNTEGWRVVTNSEVRKPYETPVDAIVAAKLMSRMAAERALAQ